MGRDFGYRCDGWGRKLRSGKEFRLKTVMYTDYGKMRRKIRQNQQQNVM